MKLRAPQALRGQTTTTDGLRHIRRVHSTPALELPRAADYPRIRRLGPVLRLCLPILLLAALAPLPAQDFRAKLTVTVTDPSGMSVPGATLELRSADTAEIFPAKTNDTGVYSFLFLQPGGYELKASAAGFKPAERTGIALRSYQASGLTVRLEVGGVTDSITVTAEGALLDTESASRGVTVDSKLVGDLTVSNHNPLMLAQTLAGVYMRPLGAYTAPWTLTSQFMINGGLMYLNEFQADGAPNNAQFGGNVYGYTPPQEAVQEVSVQANSYDAQYGRTSGGVINVSTKSGTSQFHADAWTYLKRTGWNANSFQNNSIGAARAPAPQTQWGLQVAGPVAFPKSLARKENFKAFYLFSWDKYHELLPNPLNLSYPEAEMRTGDFSKLVDGVGQPVLIYDPATTQLTGNQVRTPFPGNVIPQNRINPVAKAVAALMPTTNIRTGGVRYSTQNLRLPGNVHYWDFYNWLARADFNFGSKYRLFVRPARMLFDELSNYNGIDGPGKNGGVFSRSNHALLVDWIGTLTPTTVVNLRANASRFGAGWKSPENDGFDLASLGLPASFLRQVAQPALFGRWDFGGYTGMGQAQNWNNTNTYSVQGSITKFVGKHNLRAGFDVRLTHYLTYSTGNPFAFTSNADYTRRGWSETASEANSGDGFATFLLGTPSAGSALWDVAPFYRSWYFAPWVQDDWKVTRRLTLNFGLRHDLNLPPDEKYNRMNVGWDPAMPNPVAQQIPAAQVALYPNLANLSGGIRFAGADGQRTRATLTDINNIQPRFGMAYRLQRRVVFRGGYGLYYTNFQGNNMMQTIGYSATTSLVTSLDGGRTTIPNVLSSPFPSGIVQPYGSSQGALTSIGQAFTQYNPWYKIPRVHQFSAGFQVQLARKSVVDISYVGNRTTAYSGNINVNLPSYGFVKQCDMTAGGQRAYCDAQVTNPLRGVPALAGTTVGSASTISRFDLNRPFPHFGNITVAGLNLGRMWYNGLQINFNQRLSHGLVLNASYVRSRQIEQWGWLNPYLLIPQRSPYQFDHPHVFKLSAAYDLPFGKGRRFTMGKNPVANFFLGGWQISPSLFIQNGERADLPNNAIRLRNSHVKDVDWNQYQVRGWGGCVLSQTTGGVVSPMAYSLKLGCSATDFSQYDWLQIPVLTGQQDSPTGAGDMRMKPFFDSNLALSKTFRFRERLSFRLRMEATNVLNHFNILTAKFNTNITDPNFGTIFPASTASLDAPPRVIQIGLKASF
jgi:hypothetical protein